MTDSDRTLTLGEDTAAPVISLPVFTCSQTSMEAHFMFTWAEAPNTKAQLQFAHY